MYRGKRSKSTKHIWLLASVVLLVSIAVTGTVAYLFTHTEAVTNTFTLAEVPISVVEDPFNGETKKNVCVQNEGDVDAYIRAKIIVNWVDEEGNIYGEKPVECTCEAGDSDCTHDYTITYPTGTGWIEEGGYYYYTSDVSPNESTSILIEKCEALKTKVIGTGDSAVTYTLSVEILAQSIQAGTSDEAIKEAWGVTIANGNVNPVTTTQP